MRFLEKALLKYGRATDTQRVEISSVLRGGNLQLNGIVLPRMSGKALVNSIECILNKKQKPQRLGLVTFAGRNGVEHAALVRSSTVPQHAKLPEWFGGTWEELPAFRTSFTSKEWYGRLAKNFCHQEVHGLGTVMHPRQVLACVQTFPENPVVPVQLPCDSAHDMLCSPRVVPVFTPDGWKFRPGVLRECKERWIQCKVPPHLFAVIRSGWKGCVVRALEPAWFVPKTFDPRGDDLLTSLVLPGYVSQYSRALVAQIGPPWVVVNPYVTESSGKLRLIVPAQYANCLEEPPYFGMNSVKSIKYTEPDLLFRVGSFSKSDLRAGWYHFELHNSLKKYFCVWIQERVYCFNVLPFGISSAPYLFHLFGDWFAKLVSTTFASVRLVNYSDDWLYVWLNGTNEQWDQVVQFVTEFGWVLARTKVTPKLTRTITFLGFNANLDNNTFSIPEEKIQKVNSLIAELTGTVKAKKLASFIGKCLSFTLVAPELVLVMGPLYAALFADLQEGQSVWDRSVAISSEVHKLIQEVTVVLNTRNRTRIFEGEMGMFKIFCTYNSVAIKLEYAGGSFQCAAAISKGESVINECLKTLADFLLTMNPAEGEIYYVRGYVANDEIRKALVSSLLSVDASVAQSLVKALVHSGIRFAYVFVEKEYIADVIQLATDDDYVDDWMLVKEKFEQFDLWRKNRNYPEPVIDRFASRCNKLFTRFNSANGDPLSEGNFFQADLKEVGWMNPPFRLIPQVIDHLRSQHGTGYLLVPRRENRDWYQYLTRVAIDSFNISSKGQVFVSPNPTHHHGTPKFDSQVFFLRF